MRMPPGIACLIGLSASVVVGLVGDRSGQLTVQSSPSARGSRPLQGATAEAFSDLHNSVLYRLFRTGNLAGLEDTRYPVNYAGLRSANAKLLFLSIGIPRFSLRQRDSTTIDDVVHFLGAFKGLVADESELEFAGNRQQLEEALRHHRTGFAFALEGSHLLKGDVHTIDRLHAVGVRMIGIAHWFHNEFFVDPEEPGNSDRPPRPLTDRSTLSARGRTLLHRMVEKEMITDVSHLRKAAFYEVVAINANRAPLVASHSNSRSISDVARNLDDDQLRAIAISNGLIGISLHQPLLATGSERATVKDVVDHIDHVKRVVGTEHVAIGTDFEGGITTPVGLERIEYVTKVRDEMRARGYSEAEIGMIMWRNALRILPE
jgi:membrane dipeptidase